MNPAPHRDRLIERLREIHGTLVAMTHEICDDDYRRQYHDDLSPLGWHLGHTVFVENLWLRERVLGSEPDEELSRLYIPENCPRPERGPRLPPKDEMITRVRRCQQDNIQLLQNPPALLVRHQLMHNDYLLKFLIQHHAQHLETMRMVKTQRCLQRERRCGNGGGGRRPGQPRENENLAHTAIHFNAGTQTMIGGDNNWSYDNELPQQKVPLKPFAISTQPVSNAQDLNFIKNGGYQQPAYWNTAGRQWLARHRAAAPLGWFYANGGWRQVHGDGDDALAPDAPVCGINLHEACAFAAYAGARLPHEYEWETAARSGKLAQLHHAWEWCANTFHPYPGFRDFPYPEYSTPAFNGKHYVLRGGSRFTEPECRRLSFRNFYTADKRHIFAGLRLAFPPNQTTANNKL